MKRKLFFFPYFVIVSLLMCFISISSSSAATKQLEYVEKVAPSGLLISTETIHIDSENRRESVEWTSKSGKKITYIRIRRADRGVEWLLDPVAKRYSEYKLSPNPETSTESAKENLIPTYCNLVVSTSIAETGESQQMLGVLCRKYLIVAEAACHDKNTKAELWHHRVREESCIAAEFNHSNWPTLSDPQLQINIPTFSIPADMTKGQPLMLQPMLVMQESLKSVFFMTYLLKDLNQSVSRQRLSRAIAWTMISDDHPVNFRDQETAYTLSKVERSSSGGGFIDGPSLIAGLISYSVEAAGEHYRKSYAAAHVEHIIIPHWVRELNPDFEKEGGSAEKRQIAEFTTEDVTGLFDVPAGYKKVRQEKMIEQILDR